MGKNQPKQSPNTKLSLLLQRHLKDKGISSSKLATECSLEPSTISRIINGYGNNGNPYTPTMETIMLITRVLELNEEESRELFFAAFPYFPLWMTAIRDNLNLDKTYELMDEHGYSTLTKP